MAVLPDLPGTGGKDTVFHGRSMSLWHLDDPQVQPRVGLRGERRTGGDVEDLGQLVIDTGPGGIGVGVGGE